MLDIVVPVYNEGDGILRLFEEIQREIIRREVENRTEIVDSCYGCQSSVTDEA